LKKRLQVILAHAGIASRRKAEALIESGRVTINGKIIREKGQKADPSLEEIRLDGKRIGVEKKVYYILNKPKGVVTTVSDEKGRKTVLDLVGKRNQRIYPVGRLDKDSEGILLLTNDGQIAYRLTHPKFGVKKVYVVEVKGSLMDSDIKKLAIGVYLDGRKTAPCEIRILRKTKETELLKIVLHEGRKRKVRRMVERIGGKVKSLRRTEYAGIRLSGLSSGEHRKLRFDEVSELKKV